MRRGWVFLLLLMFRPAGLEAQSEFFKGKIIKVIVGTSAGREGLGSEQTGRHRNSFAGRFWSALGRDSGNSLGSSQNSSRGLWENGP